MMLPHGGFSYFPAKAIKVQHCGQIFVGFTKIVQRCCEDCEGYEGILRVSRAKIKTIK